MSRFLSLGLMLQRLCLGDIMIYNFVLSLGAFSDFREAADVKERAGWRQKENETSAPAQVLIKFSAKPPIRTRTRGPWLLKT